MAREPWHTKSWYIMITKHDISFDNIVVEKQHCIDFHILKNMDELIKFVQEGDPDWITKATKSPTDYVTFDEYEFSCAKYYLNEGCNVISMGFDVVNGNQDLFEDHMGDLGISIVMEQQADG